MIDFLLVNRYSPDQIKDLLAEIFDCSIERIIIYDVDEFNALTQELDLTTLDCICVLSFIRGDASQLLQLYSYRSTYSAAVKRTLDVLLNRKIGSYVPDDSSDGWIFVKENGTTKHVRQLDCDEDDLILFA